MQIFLLQHGADVCFYGSICSDSFLLWLHRHGNTLSSSSKLCNTNAVCGTYCTSIRAGHLFGSTCISVIWSWSWSSTVNECTWWFTSIQVQQGYFFTPFPASVDEYLHFYPTQQQQKRCLIATHSHYHLQSPPPETRLAMRSPISTSPWTLQALSKAFHTETLGWQSIVVITPSASLRKPTRPRRSTMQV